MRRGRGDVFGSVFRRRYVYLAGRVFHGMGSVRLVILPSANGERADMRYRKKPVVIEAFQMTEERRRDNSEWPAWMHEAWNKQRYEPGVLCPSEYPDSDGMDKLAIWTLEGSMVVDWDDWIIRSVQGELYPCKPDIFEATYGRELTRYGQGIADQEFNTYANRLSSLAGVGQTATQSTAAFGQQSANNISGAFLSGGAQQGAALQNAATARASGYAGVGNAASGAANNYLLYSSLQQGS